MTKKSFILYCDTYEHIKCLPLDEKGRLLDAIFNYSLHNEVEIDGMAGMAFSFIKAQMERDGQKYDKFLDKQKENGAKGGRPKGTVDVISYSGKVVPREVHSDSHFLYLMKDTQNNEYKIGETKNLYKRRQTIKRPTSDLLIIDFIITDGYSCQQAEKNIIQIFSDSRISGDWFDLQQNQVEDMLNLIKAVGKEEFPNIPTVNLNTQKSLNDTVNDTVNVNGNGNDNVMFKEFWENYPRQRRGGKEKALSAFKKACERDDVNNILQGLADYILSEEVESGYAKGAAAWLNDDRWRNDYFAKPQKLTLEDHVYSAIGDIDNGKLF